MDLKTKFSEKYTKLLKYFTLKYFIYCKISDVITIFFTDFTTERFLQILQI